MHHFSTFSYMNKPYFLYKSNTCHKIGVNFQALKSKTNSLSPFVSKNVIHSLACWLQWHVSEFSAGATKNEPNSLPSCFTKVKVEYYAHKNTIRTAVTSNVGFILHTEAIYN